jgi:acyl-coenzyme A thioesterase PaaI-like protein
MSDGVLEQPPPVEGFVRRYRRSPLTDPWEPIYTREHWERIDIGLWLREAHCNAREFAHGGLISTIADNGMGHSCMTMLGPDTAVVTVNLSVEFLGVANVGCWLEIESEVVKTGRSLCFTACRVSADGDQCARGTAIFKVL